MKNEDDNDIVEEVDVNLFKTLDEVEAEVTKRTNEVVRQVKTIEDLTEDLKARSKGAKAVIKEHKARVTFELEVLKALGIKRLELEANKILGE